MSGEAGSGPTAPQTGAAAPAPTQPLTDSTPGGSAEGSGSTTDSSDRQASAGGQAPEVQATSAGSAEDTVGGETVSAKTETVANGLLDGLKIVAQGVEAKERAERLAAGQAPVVFDTADSPACTDCGSIMVRNGSCYKCINCGATSGCS